MRMARGDSAMSFQTSRYKRFLSSGERFNTASTLRLIQGRRSADLPTATTKGFNRLLTPLSSRPSFTAFTNRKDCLLCCEGGISGKSTSGLIGEVFGLFMNGVEL